MTALTLETAYYAKIKNALPHCLTETNLDFGPKYVGKVRDNYDLGERLLLVTTDRLSAFDRHLASIPFKGQVLNQVSAWWFEKTKHLIPNHVLDIPHPNALLAKTCDIFPIEFVVRGYITGTTSTSLWTQYNNGVRDYCGITFPENLVKNMRLSAPVLTPTTKDKVHDKPISPAEIVADNWMTQRDWDQASQLALQLFDIGSEIAAQHGLILVDTKYEFGKDAAGNIILVDELHTPDSSRYWLKATYEKCITEKKEPDNIDKEFLRLWFKDNSDPYNDAKLPQAPEDLIITLSSRYILLYEMITGQKFQFPNHNPIETLEADVKHSIQSLKF